MSLTAQQLFDNALFGIRAQKYAVSTSESGRCAYRGDGELKCAIGFSIPDDVYQHYFDSATDSPALSEILGDIGYDGDTSLAVELQAAHDGTLKSHGPRLFEAHMEIVSGQFGLIYTPPQAETA